MSILRSQVLVQALLRRAQVAGAIAVVRQHGDDDAGSVLVLVNTLDGKAKLYGPTRDHDFNRAWECLSPAGTDYHQLENKLDQRLGSDPDLWVVEIEDRQGRHFLVESVLKPPQPS